MAKVSTSAAEARSLGFLTLADQIVMNRDHQIADAKELYLNSRPLAMLRRSAVKPAMPRDVTRERRCARASM